MNIEEMRKKRFQFLNRLHELTEGDELEFVNMFQIGEELGFDKDLTGKIAQYLEGEGLIVFRALGGYIGISHLGVREVERALSNSGRLYEKGSSADLAARGFKKIKQLSKSQLIGHKLQSFDMLLFVFVATFIISNFLSNLISSPSQFLILVVLGISLLFGLITNIIYAPILGVVCSYASNMIKPLRVGITFMFIALTTAILGFVFNIYLLSALALGLVGIHLIIISLGSLFFSKEVVEDKEIIKPRQIWNALGKIAIIVCIVGFAIDLIFIGISLL